MKNKNMVLLLEDIDPSATVYFEKMGYKVETLKDALTEDELIKKIPNIEILGIRSKTEITKNVIKYAKNLKAIGTFCIGKNHIDLSACTEKGVVVFNAPYSSTTSVVELVLHHMIDLSRRITERDTKIRLGIWDKSSKNSNEIKGKNLGIFGYGNIGQELSKIAEMLGMFVHYYDILNKKPIGTAHRCGSVSELLGVADIISLHVDGRDENNNLISFNEFKTMKSGSIFINASRGNVVNIDALTQALISGKIKGAAIDVYPSEPNNGDGFESPLLTCPNILLTPHIGGATEEAQKRIGEYVSNKIILYITEGNTIGSANFPELSLDNLVKDRPIVSYLHKNIPGKVGVVGDIIAHYGGNIIRQCLETNKNYGYMILQTDNTLVKECATHLSQDEGTLSLIIR